MIVICRWVWSIRCTVLFGHNILFRIGTHIFGGNFGFAIVDGDFEDSLALPIAGLMTNEDSHEVAEKLEKLHKTAADFGCKLDSPFMTMSFMALLVIPAIKISDKGLFDCINFEFIDVIKN